MRAKAGQSMPREYVNQGAIPEIVGHEVLRERRETQTGARGLVEQAEIVADEAGGNVDDRAPAPLPEHPPASHPERLGDQALRPASAATLAGAPCRSR